MRGAFAVNDDSDFQKILAAVRNHFDTFEDKGWKDVDCGYYDYKYIIQKGRIKGEVQFIPEPIAKAKERLHEVYSKWRDIPDFDTKDAPPQARALEREMIEAYAKAVSETSWASSYKEAMDAYAAGNSFAKYVWEMLEPTFLTSLGAGTQASPLKANANPRPSELPFAAARPSISLNDKFAIDQGVTNKLVTRERAEELRSKLRAKLNQLNSGIDPDVLAIGTDQHAAVSEADLGDPFTLVGSDGKP